MRNRRSTVMRCLVFSLALGLLASAAPSARADGMAFKARDMSRFFPVQEREQIAVIQHDGSRETLTIAINIAEAEDESGLAYDERAVWLFPVRGQPDSISIDIEPALPELHGAPLEGAAEEGLNRLLAPAYATQVYPAVALCLFLPSLGVVRGLPATALHDEVEKYGLRCQLVTSESLEDLGAWLKAQDTPIPTEHLQSFASYLDDNHALVVVSIASNAEIEANFPEALSSRRVLGRWPCVQVEFPSVEAFYPMIPTSGYRSEAILCRLYVEGFVEVSGHVSYGDDLRLTHMLAGSQPSNAYTEFGSYTLVKGEVIASALTEDLTFGRAESLRLSGRVWLARLTEWPLGLFLTIGVTALLSYLSAGLAGLAVFRRWRGVAHMGLWNLLTLVVFYIAVRDSKLAERVAEPESRWQGDHRGAASSLTLAFTAIFMVLTVLFQALLASSIGVEPF